MTFGNVQIYNSGYRTGDYLPSGDTAGAWTYLGYHEQEHTYQYQILGPLYPLFYLLVHPFSAGSPLENAAYRYGAGQGSWWPHW